MKIKNIIIVCTFLFAIAACQSNTSDDHGHDHGTEAGEHNHDENGGDHHHEEGEHHEQETFTVKEDSVMDDTHTHEDGSEHHDH